MYGERARKRARAWLPLLVLVEHPLPSRALAFGAAALFSSSEPQTARLDRFALIVPDELLHFLANVSPSAIGKERNEGKSLPPWRCHFQTLRLAASQADRTFRRGGVDLRVCQARSGVTLRTLMTVSPRTITCTQP